MVLALDLSTKSTGYAIFSNNKLITYGCLKCSSTDTIKRIKIMIDKIGEILKEYDIQTIIAEEVVPEIEERGVGNLRTRKVLMWLQAALEFYIYDNYPKINIEYIYPNDWRRKCGIEIVNRMKRTELKLADINFVKKAYDIDTNDDIADAIGIGHSYINDYKIDKEEKIEWI